MKYTFITIISLVLLASCSTSTNEAVKSEGLELSNMDTTVRPQDDIFRFANGAWLDRTVIPGDKGSWGSGNEVFEHNNEVLLELLKTAASNPEYVEGSDQRKASDFYSIGMDSLLAEKVGVSVLEPTFKKIAEIKNNKSLTAYLADQELEGGGAFFGIFIIPDLKQADKVAAYFGSGGLGLPERDYYLKTDEKSKETRDEYVKHVSKMLQLTGESMEIANRHASQILALETKLASATLTKEESRDPSKQYHKKSVADLGQMVPAIDWKSYLGTLGVTEDTLIVTEPKFMIQCQEMFASGKWDEVQTYLKWSALNGAAPFLNHAVVQESFDFNGKYLNGVEQMRPRWKRVMSTTDNFLGEAIGQLYVDKVFPPEAKAKALEMVENIKLAMADRIKQLDWMSDSTKQMALNKLSTINVKVGYPDEWKSYAGLQIEKSPEKSSYYQNAVNASRFQVRQAINKLGKPVNKKEWQMTPQTVNAYYNPLFNEIVFPAGILQPPFYNYKADEAVNYGGIGAVIGHEISHGFDDSGSRFDAEGNLKNWWGEEDLEKFKGKGKALADQYSSYEPLEGQHLQGEFTLGENIGDLGGIIIAYEGLQRYLREKGNPGLIDGYTPEQRFFLSWATIWRTKYRDEYLRTLINTDPHSPNQYRASVPLTNVDQFYKAFDVKEGDKLYRSESDRVKIW
ncbi:MAG: M13 family metallopeptidase [Cyclobacteriaceae bacterium]|nr:M13 family metallopeptidase [Cyclobacteriaceae bacterium]